MFNNLPDAKKVQRITDVEKLRFLAQWFDIVQRKEEVRRVLGWEAYGHEVQDDLRRIADKIEGQEYMS